MNQNFLALGSKYATYETAAFAVLPIPYDATASYRSGARRGPAAIIEASGHIEDFDEELRTECHKSGIATLDIVEPHADGPGAMQEAIFKRARRVVRDGKFLLALGGDHSITPALVRGVMTKYKSLSVLQIDAHCDLRDSYQGSRFSHACAMRRVLDLGARILPVGVRSVALEEHRFMRRCGIEPITARDCLRDADWVDQAIDRLGQDVYVTIDIDGFDPSVAPGTGTPEPGGLDWYQVTGLLRRVALERRIVAADVVEVMPIPGQVCTEYLAARLVHKLMGYVHVQRVAAAPRGGRPSA